MVSNFISAVLLAVGLYLFLADRMHFPTLKTSKAIRSMAKQTTTASAIEVWLSGAAEFISKYIRLNEFRKIKLERDLKAANVSLTPERFTANAIVRTVPIILLAVPVYFIMPVFSVLFILLAVAIYIRESTSLQEKIRERREAIEYDLPHFVSTVEKTLKYNRDVLAILETYEENAAPAMRDELRITIADMKTGNYESALTRLESRVNSSMLSDTVRGLISVIRGDDTDFYWAALTVKFADLQRQMLKSKAVKIPGKINKLSMVLLFCFIILYFVVLGLSMVDQMSLMMGAL